MTGNAMRHTRTFSSGALAALLAAMSALGVACGPDAEAPQDSAVEPGAQVAEAQSIATCVRRKNCPPPKVTIVSPAPGAVVSGALTLSGAASSATTLAGVAVSVDGGPYVSATGSTAWTHTLDTTSLPNGGHVVEVVATDSSGRSGSASVAVTVANGVAIPNAPPSVSISTPAPNSSLTGVVAISGSASDDVRVAAVAVSVDGGAFAAATGTDSWTASLDTRALPNGTHVVTARATDEEGVTTDASRTFAVSNVDVPAGGPAVALTHPAAGASLQGNVVLRGTATGAAALARVEVQVDSGAWLLASGTQAWSASVRSSSHANGAHVLRARVTDVNGVQATSSVAVVFANPLAGALAVEIGSLPAGTRSGLVTISGSASGAARIQARIDGLAYLPVTLLSTWSYTFDSASLANGAHTVTILAQDATGAVTTDTAILSTYNADPPPALSILAPTEGAALSGLVLVRAYGYDRQGPVQPLVSIDGGPLVASAWVDTSGLASGAHTITISATDSAGQATVASRAVTVAATDSVKPAVTILSPASGATVSGTVTLAGTANDDVGVARVELKELYGGYALATGTSSWSHVLDTHALANGAHDIVVRAVDTSGNVATRTIRLVVANGSNVERMVTPEGVVIDVDTAGGWSADAIYRMLRANAALLDVIGPALSVVVRDDGLPEGTGNSATVEGRCSPGAHTIYFNGTSGVSATYPERALAHAYGHVFAGYFLCSAQQLDWSRYLEFRGLSTEPRIDSVYPTWSLSEMIAEDYRQAFGTPAALVREDAFTNTHLPYNPGLKDFFLGVWAVPR